MTFLNDLIVKLLDSLKLKSPVFYFWFMTFLVALNGGVLFVQETNPEMIPASAAPVLAILSLIVASATSPRTTQKLNEIKQKENGKTDGV